MTISEADPAVERVARALCDFDGHDPDAQERGEVTVPWEAEPTDDIMHHDGLTDAGEPWVYCWRRYVGPALAAIAAMQE